MRSRAFRAVCLVALCFMAALVIPKLGGMWGQMAGAMPLMPASDLR